MWRGLVPGLCFLICAQEAQAQSIVTSERPEQVAVTIYKVGGVGSDFSMDDAEDVRGEGLTLVRETRVLDLPAGPVVIRFREVAATMAPQTVDVEGLPEKIVERNLDYNLLSPGSLLAKSIGEPVRLVRTDKDTGATTEEAGILQSGPQGMVVQIGNRFEALKCSGLLERLVFEKIPSGLDGTPTLTVRTNIQRAGRYTITLRYLATGLNWSANYVARVAGDGRTLDLSGWLSLVNVSETSFGNAPVEVVAGKPATTGEDEPVALPRLYVSDACWQTNIAWRPLLGPVGANVISVDRNAVGSPNETVTVTGTSIRPRDLGDYKLYPLPEPTTVAARQMKQLQFLDETAVPFERRYTYLFEEGPDGLDPDEIRPSIVKLRVQNTEKGRLGKPLPAGNVSTTASLADGPILLEERHAIDDTPIGLPVEFFAGSTMDVFSRVRAVSSSEIKVRDAMHHRYTLEVTLANTKRESVTFEWHQRYNPQSSAVISASRSYSIKDSELVWTIALRSGEEAVLRYTLEERY